MPAVADPDLEAGGGGGGGGARFEKNAKAKS